ncbi:O-methyltransferase [Flavobacteriaceae bacterium M23B6Z8]
MQTIVSYVNFLLRSGNHHSVHSPFVYKLVTQCFYDNSFYEGYTLLKAYRKDLLRSKEVIKITDYGAGSRVFKSDERKISKLIKTAGISLKRAYLLHRLTFYLNCETILELGTSLGLASVAMAAANTKAKVTTVEGCAETASKAAEQMERFGITNCKVLNKTFEEFFSTAKLPIYDMVYLDGNHKKESTLKYFESLVDYVHNDSIMILDDIHWSHEMEEAWNEIREHPKVTVSIDTYQWGILFFRKEQVKEHFIIRI